MAPPSSWAAVLTPNVIWTLLVGAILLIVLFACESEQQPKRKRRGGSRGAASGDGTHRSGVSEAMVTELQNIFPGIPDSVAARSLRSTQSVQKTVQLVLDGKLTWENRTAASANVSVEVAAYMNNSGQTTTYAMEGYTEKKQQMIEEARSRFLERTSKSSAAAKQ